MIVIGGSLGSMAALHTILRDLPKSFSRPIAVVLHRHKDSDDALMTILQRDIALTVREVVDKEPIQLCCVHIAPSDYHLLVETMCFSLSTDEPVQFARPSIDVLFESAADVYGSEAIAIILTGANRDGAAGAREIRRRGGTVIVQQPDTAESAVMPKAAIQAVPDALIRPPGEIGRLLIDLVAIRTPPSKHD
jgi:two-component system chemotaxis response regulator CheB